MIYSRQISGIKQLCLVILVTLSLNFGSPGNALANKWELFSSPSSEQQACFLKNGLNSEQLRLLKSGKPKSKKIRKKAKKALKICKKSNANDNTSKLKNLEETEILKTSPFGKDLQVLKIDEAALQAGTTILMVPQKHSVGQVVEIDSRGNVLWKYNGKPKFGRLVDAKLTSKGTLLIGAEKGAYEVERSGRVIWSYVGNVSHDLDRLSNGNTIINYGWGAKGEIKIIEVDQKGDVVWEWDGMKSHNVAPYNTAFANDAILHNSKKTWIHNNGITVLDNKQILLSLRDFQEIVWINKNGDVLNRYRFKCRAKKRALQTKGKIKGCNPHEPQQLDTGNIVVGLRNPDRAIEFNPKTHEIAWQWRSPNDDLYGTIRDVDKLKNGNYLVVTGGHMLEIDKTGKIVVDIGAKPTLGIGHRILYKAQRVYPDGSFSHD